MKKLSFCLLIITLLLVLCSCNKYKPVESTDEEERVVFALEAGGEKYEVKYELYRALFLANRERVDGGDASVWSGERKEQYASEINSVILAESYKIYSAIHHAKELGFDAYSKDVDKKIRESIENAVDTEYDGDYEKYLASLKENYFNYSVSVLFLRYYHALEAINKYYGGYEHEVFGEMNGEFEITKDTVKEYYYSTDTVRVMQAYIPEGVRTKAWVAELRDELMRKGTEYDMAVHIITNTTATESDLIVNDAVSGLVIGKNSLDSFTYSDYIDELFALSSGEMSAIIELQNTDADGYYLLYALAKSDEHFERCYETIKDSYIDDVIGAKLAKATDELMENTSHFEVYFSIDHANISMD